MQVFDASVMSASGVSGIGEHNVAACRKLALHSEIGLLAFSDLIILVLSFFFEFFKFLFNFV